MLILDALDATAWFVLAGDAQDAVFYIRMIAEVCEWVVMGVTAAENVQDALHRARV